MSERLERITPEMDEEKALGLILDELMDRADPDVAEAIRFCAIPHWFDEEILAWLRGERREPSQRTREILAELTELTVVGPYHDRGYAYHENVRNLLLHRWRQENAERFQELGGVAAAYYADKLGMGKSWLARMADKVRRALRRERVETEEPRAEWQREEMYHLLVADNERGFELFYDMFGEATSFYRLSTCDHLLKLVEEQQDHLTQEHQLWWRLGRGKLRRDSGEWQEALEIFEGLWGEDLPSDLESTLANDLGSLYKAKGEWDKAIEYYQHSLEIDKKVGDEHGMATTFNNLGLVYNAKGEGDKAIEYYQRSLEIDKKVGDEHGMATTFNNLGAVYQAKGEWDKAIDYFERDLAICEKVGDEHGMAPAFNNLGFVYQAKGEWDKAIEHYQRSLEIAEKMGDEHGMATTFDNLGSVYKAKGEWDKAIEYFQRDLAICEKVGDEYGMAYSHNNIAILYQTQGRLEEAISLFEKSLKIFERIDDKPHTETVQGNLEAAKRELEAKREQE
jgi:tetratricopeptide (TPR) repeat protein